MSPQLESSVAEMTRCLKSLFSVIFCTSQGEPSISQQLLTAISQIKELLQTRLADYEDYLLVKGQRNITMTTYPFCASNILNLFQCQDHDSPCDSHVILHAMYQNNLLLYWCGIPQLMFCLFSTSFYLMIMIPTDVIKRNLMLNGVVS